MTKPTPKAKQEATNGFSVGDDVIVHGETIIGDDGTLQSAVGKVVLTEDMLDVILAKDVKEIHDVAGSYVQDETITRALLAQDKLGVLPGPNDLPIERGPSDHGDEPQSAANMEEDRRPYVGATPQNKWMPEGIPEAGKDPLKIRKFIGDEFPRMLAYSPPTIGLDKNGRPHITEPAKPAYMSHWPEGTDPKDMKVIKVNIATKLPEYMIRGSVAAAMEGRKNFSFNGQSLDESFIPITTKVEKAWRRYAKDFEKTFGIRLDIRRDDDDEPHAESEINISVCGFAGGNPQLAGFASFPQGLSKWPNFGGLGHPQGYMMLNHEYCNSSGIKDDQVYDLILHEMGHFFGWVHPHDLGAMNMTQAEALNSTAMAYTDGKFSKFEGQEGITAGVVDLYFRRYMANPPELNTEYGTIYDLEKQFGRSGGENWQSRVRAVTNMIPAVPIINNGAGAVLVGTRNSDILDTEPGHMSIVQNPTGDQQRFALVEGHMTKVYGLAGNNHIFASRKGKQDIFPGPGENHIHIYGPEVQDNKVIHSKGPGRDALVLHQDIFLKNKGLTIEQDGNDIIFASKQGRIVLKDQLKRENGISSINVIDDEGRSVLEQDVSRYDLAAFKQGLLTSMRRHVRLIEQERVALKGSKQDQAADVVDPNHPHVHDIPPTLEAEQAEEAKKDSGNVTHLPRSFVARVQKQAEDDPDKQKDAGRGA